MSAMWEGCLPDTDYLEVTAASGRTFGVWVTVPPGYAEATELLPLIYVMDGNWAVGQTAPLIVTQNDPYLSIAPYIQVSVGYAGEEAAHWARLRNRDLVPPGEPVSEEMESVLAARRDAGAMTQEAMDAYLGELRNTRADLFLEILTNEIHPRLVADYRVAESGHGLFGYSYGGLFALYAWLTGSDTFTSVGAGSPGVAHEASQVFKFVTDLGVRGGNSCVPTLHVTLNEAELLGAIPLYRGMARNVLHWLEQVHATAPSHLVSHALLQQTHVTGLQASFLSYLRNCHAR